MFIWLFWSWVYEPPTLNISVLRLGAYLTNKRCWVQTLLVFIYVCDCLSPADEIKWRSKQLSRSWLISCDAFLIHGPGVKRFFPTENNPYNLQVVCVWVQSSDLYCNASMSSKWALSHTPSRTSPPYFVYVDLAEFAGKNPPHFPYSLTNIHWRSESTCKHISITVKHISFRLVT